MSIELHNQVRSKDQEIQPLLFAYFVQQIFRLRPEHHILAILAYGSTLSSTTKTETSTPDFYVIVDNYDEFYTKPTDRFLNKHLPPNIYHIHTPQASCKYCVISIQHLTKEVSEKTKDVYHLGRFSKRMGIVWTRDQDTEKKIVECQVSAILSVSKKVLQALETNFTLDEFIRRCLFLSYEGDVRVEASDKVDKIFTSEKTYYESIFQQALTTLGFKQNEINIYEHPKSALTRRLDRFRFKKFINQSRGRARMRWPKNMFTVDQWLDYVLAKIERTQGIKLDLSPTEKKYWYIFGWKYFLRLSRKKLIK